MNAHSKHKQKMHQYMTQFKYNDRIRIKNGTFLHTYCPRCSESLIFNNHIRVIAVQHDGSIGDLFLSPYLSVFDKDSSIKLESDTTLKDMICPHCNASLARKDVVCTDCQSLTAELSVAAVQTRVPFFICLTADCKWHGISEADEKILIADSSDEW